MIEVREYVDRAGDSPFANWFDHLNSKAAAKVATAVTRLAAGNFSNVKGVGPECLSIESISVRDIGSISAKTESVE